MKVIDGVLCVPKATRERHLRTVSLALMKMWAADGYIDDKRPLGNSDIEGDVLRACKLDHRLADLDKFDSYEEEERFNEPWLKYAREVFDAVPSWLAKKARR